MSDLAQRLVRAAAEAIATRVRTPEPWPPCVIPEAWRAEGSDAVVAVLRELAADMSDHPCADVRLYGEEVTELADSIEKGGQGG